MNARWPRSSTPPTGVGDKAGPPRGEESRRLLLGNIPVSIPPRGSVVVGGVVPSLVELPLRRGREVRRGWRLLGVLAGSRCGRRQGTRPGRRHPAAMSRAASVTWAKLELGPTGRRCRARRRSGVGAASGSVDGK
jgi:hypothetical protein